MLTTEQEKERAVKLSKLYDRSANVVVTQDPEDARPFSVYSLWKVSFILLLPVVVINLLIVTFLGLGYSSTADVQGAGIAFVVTLILMGLVLFKAALLYRQKAGMLIYNEGFLFWLILLFLTPVILLVDVLFAVNSISGFLPFIFNLGMSTFFILLIASLYILLLAHVLEGSEKSERYIAAFLLAVLPGLAYAIISRL